MPKRHFSALPTPTTASVTSVTAPVIDVQGLVKTFGSFRALDGFDLRVGPGEVHGFLGPNGAGKSTTIRILLGLMRASSGTVRLFGEDPWRNAPALHRRLAYVPGDVSLWPNLSGGETIDLLLRMRGIEPTASRKAEMMERFHFDPTKKGRAYSKGNRQKVALVAALAGDVELLVLDEPTSGLDPVKEEVFREVVREEAARGRTVLLSSHILSEVEALCERVSIIREGRTVETGTLSELRHLTETTVDAVPALISKESIELFGKYKVLNERELHSRYEIYLENYKKTINIEAQLTASIAKTQILPAAIRYQGEVAHSLAASGKCRWRRACCGHQCQLHLVPQR